MASKKKKGEFSWEKGGLLSKDLYDPVGNVRQVGFSKLADGIPADPALRKEVRKSKLSKAAPIKDKQILVEESVSGLQEEYTPSEAARLIQKDGSSVKGIFRFNKPTPKGSVGKNFDKDKGS